MGCCLFAVLLAGAPRFAFVLWWLFQPARFSATFHTIFWPILGVLFIPWTTFMYVIVYPGGIHGIDWLFLALALAIDIGTHVGSGTSGRRRYSSD